MQIRVEVSIFFHDFVLLFGVNLELLSEEGLGRKSIGIADAF